MPEGHTIHRAARLQRKDFRGEAVAVSSPQGWATAAAAAVDGRVLTDIDAYGKHLFYRFEGVPDALHVHLGLFGRFRRFAAAKAPPPRNTTRLRFETGTRILHLSGATASDLLDPIREDELLARLGPDPLRADADPDRAFAALGRRRSTIAAALMDQRVIAGIGNVYRAEILRECGMDPLRAAKTVDREEFDTLWASAVHQLRKGARSGRIRDKQVYRRARCGVCGTRVKTREVAARKLYWCPACQKK